MAKQIGINTIGKVEWPSLIAGDFPRVTEEVTAGEDLVLGSLVYRDTDGTVKKCRTTSDTIHGVVSEDINDGDIGTLWLTGEFIGPRITVADPDNVDWEDFVDSARAKSIFLKDARLAPNQ